MKYYCFYVSSQIISREKLSPFEKNMICSKTIAFGIFSYVSPSISVWIDWHIYRKINSLKRLEEANLTSIQTFWLHSILPGHFFKGESWGFTPPHPTHPRPPPPLLTTRENYFQTFTQWFNIHKTLVHVRVPSSIAPTFLALCCSAQGI